jgi:hypothetical protein
MHNEDQDQKDREDFNVLIAFAIVGTATTVWALAVGGFAIWIGSL